MKGGGDRASHREIHKQREKDRVGGRATEDTQRQKWRDMPGRNQRPAHAEKDAEGVENVTSYLELRPC